MNRIQQIFTDHAEGYIARYGHRMPNAHHKAVRAILNCRRGGCGHHVYRCPDCGETHRANSSCGNRHCPVCQHDRNIDWVYRQQLNRLPCTYFFATFTLPEGTRRCARAHQRVFYRAMFDCAAESLKTLEADPRFVGAKLSGFFGVLHTWTRQLEYHPHLHFIIPGGGLNAARDEWISAKGHFLVHVKALSRMFRGKMKARLRKEGLLDLIPEEVWQEDWVVHCKAVGDGRRTIKYLGAYVFRVALSDARIVTYDGQRVTFKYQRVGQSKWRLVTLDAFEFMRRYLQHVLPRGFVKVRHYGFCSPNSRISIQRIRELICVLYETLRDLLPEAEPPPRKKPLRCRRCNSLLVWVCFMVRSPPGASPG